MFGPHFQVGLHHPCCDIIVFECNHKSQRLHRKRLARFFEKHRARVQDLTLETHPESTGFGARTLSLAHVPAAESFGHKTFRVIVHDAPQAAVVDLRGGEAPTRTTGTGTGTAPAALSPRDAAAAPQQDSARAL